MTVSSIREHIEIVEGARGPKARIVGSRIRVRDVVHWHQGEGWSPERIVEEFPTISLADVHAALAYYHDHREELERRWDEDDAFAESVRRSHRSPLQEKLDRVRASRG